MAINPKNTEFGTEEEKKFLDKLGTHSPENPTPLSRAVLLWNYISASGKRKNWGNIDKREVISHANKLYTAL